MVRRQSSSRAKFFFLPALLALAVFAAGASVKEAPAQQQAASASVDRFAALGDEIPELRGRYSRRYVKADGNYVAAVSQTPLNFKDERGYYQQIDSTLVPAPGGYQNRANDVRIHVPANLAAPVRVQKDDFWATFQLVGAEAEASVERASATYADALPGVTARYTAIAEGVKEELVLEDRSAVSEFRFVLLATPHLTPRLSGNAVELVNPAGNATFVFRPPFMADSSKRSSGYSRAVSLSLLDDAAPGYVLTLTPDRTWLHDPRRVFPVTIDPTLTTGPHPSGTKYSDCHIASSPYDTTNYCASDFFWVGRDTAEDPPYNAYIARSLLKFDVSDVPSASQVLEGELVLGVASYYQSGDPVDIGVHRLTRSYDLDTTWNSADGVAAWTTPGGDFDPTPAATTTVTRHDTDYSWYPTSLVQGWVDGSIANHGFLVKSASESLYRFMLICSADYTWVDCGPVLYVTYAEEEPDQVDDPTTPTFEQRAPVSPPDPEPSDCAHPDANDEGDPDPILCGGGGAAPAAMSESTAPAVTISSNADGWTFENSDAKWTIYRKCFDTGPDSSPRVTVGPGYFARVVDKPRGRLLVNDERPVRNPSEPYINAVEGGLGTFGWHHARGPARGTYAGNDPTTPADESQTVNPAWRTPPVIEGKMCAPSNLVPGKTTGHGVCARSPKGPTRNGPIRVDFTMDVWLRDGTDPAGCPSNAIARIRYRYSFYRSSVRVWISVRTMAKTNTNGTPFVKEPKIAAVLRGGDYTRVSAFGGSKGVTYQTAVMKGKAEPPPGQQVSLSTEHAAGDSRKRVQWDYGKSIAPNQSGVDPDPSPCAESACFSVVMRRYPPGQNGNITRTNEAKDWENPDRTSSGSGYGLDGWALASGGLATSPKRAVSYMRDTDAEGVASCGVVPNSNSDYDKSKASEKSDTSDNGRRRWEFGGWKPGDPQNETNPNPYTAAFTFFNGWDNEAGPKDCEPLQRAFRLNAWESWGTFGVYSLGCGWGLQPTGSYMEGACQRP